MLLHISNRYLDLDSVLGAIVQPAARGHGRDRRARTCSPTAAATAQSTSTVAIFAKSEAALEPFRALEGVSELEDGGLRAWTDDYSDIWRRVHEPGAGEGVAEKAIGRMGNKAVGSRANAPCLLPIVSLTTRRA